MIIKPTFFRNFIILSIFIVSLVFFSGYTYAADASLTFSPDKVELPVGGSTTVNIMLDTGGNQVAGAGARILYDPGVVSVVELNPGNLFGDYPSALFDNYLGKANLSGIVSSANSLYSGSGTFGSFKLQGIKTGTSVVKFDFTPGSTKDSNIAVTTGNGDILTEVNELEVVVTDQQVSIIPTVPIDSSYLANHQPKKKGIVTKLKGFLGIKENEIDPYQPLPSQDPNRSTHAQNINESEGEFDNRIVLVFGVVLIVLILFVTTIFIKNKKKKGKIDETSVYQKDI